MKRFLLQSVLLAGLTPVLLASSAPLASEAGMTAKSASGNGSFHFGHDGEGVAMVKFDVVEGSTTGELQFGAENHGEDDHLPYPDTVIRLEKIDNIVFRGNSVTFSGHGVLHLDEVFIKAKAVDGADGVADSFVVQCYSEGLGGDEGEMLFEARGDFYIGDIAIDGKG